jgi:DNA uptake protein ComE-like DNA-binding protein
MEDMSSRARIVIIAMGWLALLFPVSGVALVRSVSVTEHAQVSPTAEDKVDINSATAEQLMKVPGMKRTWALRIIRYRPYRAKNDLLDRGVVTSQVYERMKDYIVAHRVKQ